MTYLPRILDRNRKPRRAPSDPWAGYRTSYQVFDETQAHLLDMFAYDNPTTAQRRPTDRFSWTNPAVAQHVDALTRRIYGERLAPDVTAFTRYMLGFDPVLPNHLWAAATTTPGWLQHAPQPDKDPTALAEASVERGCPIASAP